MKKVPDIGKPLREFEIRPPILPQEEDDDIPENPEPQPAELVPAKHSEILSESEAFAEEMSNPLFPDCDETDKSVEEAHNEFYRRLKIIESASLGPLVVADAFNRDGRPTDFDDWFIEFLETFQTENP